MDGIDPRLRDAAPQHYEQHQRPSVSYNAATSQGTAYDALPHPIATPSAGQNQQHQYYGMPTPGSYSSGPHQETGGSPYENQGPQNSSDLNDLKRPRACEACRQLKVRCEPDEHSPTGSCRRCAKAGRQCVVTAPSRKRQKKTDSRVAELEKKIDALTATLHAQRGPGSADTAVDPAVAQAQMAELEQQRGQLYGQQSWQDRSRDSPGRRESSALSSPVIAEPATGSKRKFRSEAEISNEAHENSEAQTRRKTVLNPPSLSCLMNNHPPGAKEAIDHSYIDVVDRHIIDASTAYRVFNRYNTEMQFLPVVVFPAGTKAEDIRRSKPVLFLAILSAASNTIRPDLQPIFIAEIMRLLADRIICRGEKTLELVQSLQVITVFYQPPERLEELNFNQLIHIAMVMGTDIGMGKRSRPGQSAPLREPMCKVAHPHPDAAETRRAWLGLYFMCANAAMSLRRPLLVRWSAYMEESLEILAKAPDALPSDKWLAHVVRSQHIAEEVGYQFSMDDPPSDVSITQPKVQYHMKTFEKQLDEWRRSSTLDMPQDLLKHNDAIIDLYIHEIAMHHSHNIDDFRPPYGVEEENDDAPDYITPAHIDSLTICLDSIHKAFDAFIRMPISALRSLPTLFFVRNSYAAVALIKMYTGISAKGSKFGSVFKPKDLKIEYYLDTMIEKTKKAGEGGRSRIALKFTFILGMLKSWQAKRAAVVVAHNKTKPNSGAEAFDAEYEKERQQQLAHNAADSKPASWNPAATTVSSNAKNQHSGLHMLSEVAMGNNNTTPSTTTNMQSDPAAALAATTTNKPSSSSSAPPPVWDAPLTAYADMQPQSQPQQQPQPQTSNVPPSTADGASFPHTGYTADIDNFFFTAEDLGALSSMMDESGWLTFGLESGAWAL